MLGQELCHCFIPSRLLCCWTHLHVWKLSLREVKSQSIKAEPVFHSGLDGLLAEILPLGPGLRSPCFYQCPLQSLLSSELPDHPQVEDAFSRLRILSGSQLTLDDESPHRGAGRGPGCRGRPFLLPLPPPCFLLRQSRQSPVPLLWAFVLSLSLSPKLLPRARSSPPCTFVQSLFSRGVLDLDHSV